MSTDFFKKFHRVSHSHYLKNMCAQKRILRKRTIHSFLTADYAGLRRFFEGNIEEEINPKMTMF